MVAAGAMGAAGAIAVAGLGGVNRLGHSNGPNGAVFALQRHSQKARPYERANTGADRPEVVEPGLLEGFVMAHCGNYGRQGCRRWG